MAKLHLKRSLSGFVPADAESEATAKRFKQGEIYRATISKPRSYRHHCLFMSLLELCFQNQDTYTDAQMFRRAIALEAGHVRIVIDLHGESHIIPLAYSYDEIPDEDDFTVAFGKAMAVCQRLMHNIGASELEGEVSKYAAAHYGITP